MGRSQRAPVIALLTITKETFSHLLAPAGLLSTMGATSRSYLGDTLLVLHGGAEAEVCQVVSLPTARTHDMRKPHLRRLDTFHQRCLRLTLLRRQAAVEQVGHPRDPKASAAVRALPPPPQVTEPPASEVVWRRAKPYAHADETKPKGMGR